MTFRLTFKFEGFPAPRAKSITGMLSKLSSSLPVAGHGGSLSNSVGFQKPTGRGVAAAAGSLAGSM
jgi:D-alanyl-D-alanine carboxypeptidase